MVAPTHTVILVLAAPPVFLLLRVPPASLFCSVMPETLALGDSSRWPRGRAQWCSRSLPLACRIVAITCERPSIPVDGGHPEAAGSHRRVSCSGHGMGLGPARGPAGATPTAPCPSPALRFSAGATAGRAAPLCVAQGLHAATTAPLRGRGGLGSAPPLTHLPALPLSRWPAGLDPARLSCPERERERAPGADTPPPTGVPLTCPGTFGCIPGEGGV